jgi:pimeloyl-ACP methyl ester carboxylesterase
VQVITDLGRADPRTDAYGPIGRSPWLDVDWSRHQRWVTVEDRPINVIDMGSGPPIVFIHGLAGSWQNWLEQLPVFAVDRRVIALDLPGFGRSPMPRETISIAGYARLVASLLQALEVQDAVVVGNSMGGFIAAEIAITYPTLTSRLVLVSAAGITTEHLSSSRVLPTLRAARRGLFATAGWLAAQSDFVARRSRLRRATLSVVTAHPERLPAPLVSEQIRGSGTPGFMDALDAMAHYAIRKRLPEIGCPTLIIWGEVDRLVPLRDADVFLELIPDARKIVYADTGHVSMLERPERFNADLEAFLES